MGIIKKKRIVCIRNNCKGCKLFEEKVPRNCPYKILHVLEVQTSEVQARSRRSGKTTELVRIANECAKHDIPVYYLVHRLDMERLLYNRYRLSRHVKVVSLQSTERLNGQQSGVIIADDVSPQEVERVKKVAPNQKILAHYWTPGL
jgi:hypothetical protein